MTETRNLIYTEFVEYLLKGDTKRSEDFGLNSSMGLDGDEECYYILIQSKVVGTEIWWRHIGSGTHGCWHIEKTMPYWWDCQDIMGEFHEDWEEYVSDNE
jgi:hypothetical protein